MDIGTNLTGIIATVLSGLGFFFMYLLNRIKVLEEELQQVQSLNLDLMRINIIYSEIIRTNRRHLSAEQKDIINQTQAKFEKILQDLKND